MQGFSAKLVLKDGTGKILLCHIMRGPSGKDPSMHMHCYLISHSLVRLLSCCSINGPPRFITQQGGGWLFLHLASCHRDGSAPAED